MHYFYLSLVVFAITACSNVKKSDRELVKNLQDFNVPGIKKELERDIHPGQEGEFFLTFAFFDACSKGDVKRVKELLAAGSNIHAVTSLGKTALHLACESEGPSTELVKLLLDKGLDINGNFKTPSSVEKFDWSPLAIACVHKNTEVAVLLMERGANIEEKDAGGDTPLLKASRYGAIKIIEELLKRNANVKAVDNEGNTALHNAFSGYATKNLLFPSFSDPYSEEDFEKIMDLLLDYGADIYAENNEHKTVKDLIQDFKKFIVGRTNVLDPAVSIPRT